MKTTNRLLERFRDISRGYTPTHEEADAIVRELRYTAHGWSPKMVDPEHEALRYILVEGDMPVSSETFNAMVREAYRRGQKSRE